MGVFHKFISKLGLDSEISLATPWQPRSFHDRHVTPILYSRINFVMGMLLTSYFQKREPFDKYFINIIRSRAHSYHKKTHLFLMTIPI